MNPAEGRERAPSRTAAWMFAGLLAAGTFLRLADLENRPLHGDEAVGASLSNEVRDTGSFVYVSANRHGPFQYFLGGAVMALGGESDFWIRLPFALAGCLLPLAFLPLRGRLGDPGWVLSAGLLAFSPLLVYYSRYAIQEIHLTLATALLLGCAAAFFSGGRGALIAGTLLAAAWMITVKETFVLIWGCGAMALAMGALLGGARFRSALLQGIRRAARRPAVAMAGAGAGLVLFAAAYTDLFRDSSGLGNLARNLREMLASGATGSGAVVLHRHPPSFYLSLLLHYEGLILVLALAGAWSAFRSRRPFPLFVALYALLAGAVHLALPYKTPWLLLTPLLPLALLAGYGGGELWESLGRTWERRLPLPAILLVVLLPLPRTLLLNFARPADPVNEPLVYHQTGQEQVDLAREIRRVLAGVPTGVYPRAVICLPYAWPLAWYLRDEPGVVYSKAPAAGGLEQVPVLVTLESADRKFLEVFTGSTLIPPFSPPGYVGWTYVLVPPEYMVARLWIRSDLASPPAGR